MSLSPESGPGHHPVLILGSGPAGLTAATYAARAMLAPLVLEGEPSSTGDQPGGQLMLTTDVENYPGFPEGIQGPDLMGLFKAQAERFGTELRTTKARRVDLAHRPIRVWTTEDGDEHSLEAAALIIATGARSLMLNVPGEQALMAKGVSTCATCDGFFFRGQHIAVVGGGDSAMEEALFLTRFAETVTIIHRRDTLRASRIMADRALANPKIRFVWNSVVTEVLGDSSVTGVRIENSLSGAVDTLDITGLFVAVGHRPNSDLFSDQLQMDGGGYIERIGHGSHTSVPGVFVCGDVCDPHYRQAITSAGSGCMAAIDAERWLENQEWPSA